MDKRQHKRKALAQNFLKDPALVRRLIRNAKIGPEDLVYEIGSGKGIITAALARVARKVIAIEKDPRLACASRERFREQTHVVIVEKDFLAYPIRADGPYKIFANIPFNITAAVVRKILHAPPTPTEAFLIMQREPARKFAGVPAETLFSLLAKPYWEFQILHRFRRTDFHPVPHVDSVLLRIRRRSELPSLSKEGCPFHGRGGASEKRAGACTCWRFTRDDAALYRDFVQYGFNGWKRNLRSAFKNVFTYTQWKRLSRDLHFPLNASPTELTFEQWLGLYHGYKHLKK